MRTSLLTSRRPAAAPPIPGGALDVLVWSDRRRVVVAPCGEIDLASVGRVARQIERVVGLGFAEVVLDLRQVTFMDSSGARLLWGLSRTADGAADPSFSVVAGPPPVQRVLDLTGVTGRLRYVDPVMH